MKKWKLQQITSDINQGDVPQYTIRIWLEQYKMISCCWEKANRNRIWSTGINGVNGVGRLFRHQGTLNVKVQESDFMSIRVYFKGSLAHWRRWERRFGVEVEGCRSVHKHQCLELDAGSNWQPVELFKAPPHDGSFAEAWLHTHKGLLENTAGASKTNPISSGPYLTITTCNIHCLG